MKHEILGKIAFSRTNKQFVQRMLVLFFYTINFMFLNFIPDKHLAHLVSPFAQGYPSHNPNSPIANRIY
jgi:hypothetical protein